MIRWPYKWRKIEGRKSKIPYWGAVRYILDCIAENMFIKLSKIPTDALNKNNRNEKIVVSLTSFPARLDQCFYSIKSLLLQDYKPDRVVLWLASEQFPDKKLPEKYSELLQLGVEIKFCDDLKAHKKYFYMLQEQKNNEVVITFDDDIIYESDAILKLIGMHQKFPRSIICNRGFQMTCNEDEVLEYNKWKIYSDVGVGIPVYNVLPSTGAGCLYPYNIMPATTFNIELIKKYAWTADDLWMKFNSLSHGVKVVKTKKDVATLCNVYGSQKEALTNINNLMNENQRTIERLETLFPNVKNILLNEGNINNN